MRTVFRGLRITATAFVMTVGLSFAASADDFIKECKVGNPGAESDKVCKCMSDKITGADRPDAIDAMKKTNAAMTQGSSAAAANMTPKVMKSIETVMTAQVSCM